MDPERPRAEAVAVRGGRIVAVGTVADARRALDADPKLVDCAGGELLPAFIDAHCHLLAYAASLRSVDCSNAYSISEIQRLIRARAAELPKGRWLRAVGYEETALAERRHPNRGDLDAAAPEHLVRLIHRSGHASVLNSAALQAAGISTATEEAPGGSIDRDIATGEPSGLLLGMERVIARAVPAVPYEKLSDVVRDAVQRFLSAGVASIQDATHTNGRAEWELFERLIMDGSLRINVVLMEGFDHLGELPEAACGGRLRRGPVKIMLRELGHELSPDEDELPAMVLEAHAAGRQVAIHAVGERAVVAAASAIQAAVAARPRPDHRHRIEHCGQLPPGMASRLVRLGVVVVSQPSYVRERGDRYLQFVPKDQRSRLYAFRTLRDAGVSLAAGSDAPVTAPEPLSSVAAAVERTTAAGMPLVPEQAVGVFDALSWWTAGAAHAAFQEEETGALRPGLRADLMLLPAGSTALAPRDLRGISVSQLWREGSEVSAEIDVSAEHK